MQSADYLLRAASLSLLSNVKLDLIQGSGTSTGAVRRQTLSLQSEKRLSGSGECFKFSQAGVSLLCYYPTAQTKTPELEPRAQVKSWPGQSRERPYTGHRELAWLKSIISLIGARLGTGDTPHHVIYQFCRDVIVVQLSRPIIDPILQCEKNRERAVTNRSPTIMCLHARKAGDKYTCQRSHGDGVVLAPIMVPNVS